MIDRVKNLEKAIQGLEPSEFKRFAAWFASYQQRQWDQELARDSKAGKLDFLVKETRAELDLGATKEI